MTITLTMKGNRPWEVPAGVPIGTMPDPKGSKLTMILPYRVLVKETPQQIINKFNELDVSR